jgi:hypothetical protein
MGKKTKSKNASQPEPPTEAAGLFGSSAQVDPTLASLFTATVSFFTIFAIHKII